MAVPVVAERVVPAPHTHASRAAIVAIGGLSAGLLLAAGYALHPIWWTCWLAPLPMLAACRTEREARVAGCIAGGGAMVAILPYYIEMTGWIVALAITALRIGGWGLSARLAFTAARRLPLPIAMLVLPVTQAAVETLTLILSPHGAAGSLAYSQMMHPELVQVAALGGVPAVVFQVLLPGSLAGAWMVARPAGARAWWAPAILLCLGMAAFLFGRAQLAAVDSARRVPVAMIASDRFAGIPHDWESVWRVYRPAVVAGGKGSTVTVLPEKIALLDEKDVDRAIRDVAAAARFAGTTIVLGLEVRDRAGFRNRALAVSPSGHVSWYDKQRLVPGFEDRDRPGTSPVRIDAASVMTGLAICKDMHVPGIAREYAGVGLMAVPAWDFGQDDWMGSRMTAMRAVENGYAIARSARNGLIGVYDAAGRALGEKKTGASVSILNADVPVGPSSTFYGRVDDLFGWLCAIATFTLVAQLRRRPAMAGGGPTILH